jgi:HD-GYP domain-containing protein (c-di-GMP phosphodiesterase class II)
LRLTHINRLAVGARIARPIHHMGGGEFVAAGDSVDNDLLAALRDARISRVYTMDPLTDDAEIADLLTEETRVEAYECVADAFASHPDASRLRRVANDMVREARFAPEVVHGVMPIYRVEEYVVAHAVTSALYAVLAAVEAGIPDGQCVSLAQGMLLHDIGTQGQLSVLHENGELTEAEREITKGHTRLGFESLRDLLNRSPIGRSIALLHHERLDGSGYPRGLAGDEISPVARIAGLADTYAALIADRPHRAAGLPDEAFSYFLKTGAAKFDQDQVRGLARRTELYPPGMWVRLRDGRCGIVLGSRVGATVRPRVRLLQDEQRRPLTDHEDIDLSRHSDAHIADVFYD